MILYYIILYYKNILKKIIKIIKIINVNNISKKIYKYINDNIISIMILYYLISL